jgi:uncharacterized protein YycO
MATTKLEAQMGKPYSYDFTAVRGKKYTKKWSRHCVQQR